MHLELDEELVKRLDKVVGPRGRGRFIRQAIQQELEHEKRLRAFDDWLGKAPNFGSDWGMPPDEWVHQQRFADPRRVG
jgi:hypothetical protein